MEAVYVYVWKVSTDGNIVKYNFSPKDGDQGTLGIDISTGDMHLITPCPCDDVNTYYTCACKAIWNKWAVGLVPETAQYVYGS